MDFTVSVFRTDDADRMAAAVRVRQVVFCDEQGVSAELEWDGLDEACEHFLLESNDGQPVATARLRLLGDGAAKIERVAVLKDCRNTQAGRALMDFVMARAKLHRPRAIVLNAQVAVEGFYSKLGFVADSEPFDEAGIPHVHMTWQRRPRAR